MAAPAAASAPRRQWRYTWEALTHLPLLRLYLFPRPAFSSSFPSDLRADLRLQGSLLHLSFSLPGDGATIALRVPVPRVLIDPSAPFECRAAAAGDHLELLLALVLPVDHPVVAAAFPPPAGAELPAPLALRDDLKGLSTGDVHLYCRNCSSRLTKQPLRPASIDYSVTVQPEGGTQDIVTR
uniref:Ubiquitin-conjugating enzyme E2C-binding protein n=1 Tax=Zea mays TaxID=4577 RepID=A0A804P553_MAIZE